MDRPDFVHYLDYVFDWYNCETIRFTGWAYQGAPTTVATPAYPIGGEAVPNSVVEMRWSGAWIPYSGVEIQVKINSTGGADIYTFKGLAENEHDDGETRHLMSSQRPSNALGGNGPVLLTGTNYYWRARSIHADEGNASLPNQAWSSWAHFTK